MRNVFLACLFGAATLAAVQPGLTQGTAPAPAPAKPARAGESMTVYQNALGAGWQDRSWAKIELGIDTGNARKPIRVQAGPWQALYLYHAAFSATPYRKLSILIQSMPPGGQPVRVIALSDGKPLTPEGKVVTLKPGGWTKVEIPLTLLNPDNAMIDGIWVQNGTDQPLPNFYVADIMFE